MRKATHIIALITSAAVSAMTLVMPFRAHAAETYPVSAQFGSWKVTTLARESAGTRVEAYKLDRNLIAWTEVNAAAGVRSLFSYDGVNVKTLAVMHVDEWNDAADSAFFDPVSGSFDVADGLVVWTKREGTDREIFSFDGYEVRKISDNAYDDKHPITSNGRIAWTSLPGSSYNLMVRDAQGVRRVDSWHVLNYAFSGGNLYWLNKRGAENWFRVFVNDGSATRPVGEGDDRSMRKYFFSDDKGTVAWEYSTKRWDYDKRVIYLSHQGADAVRIAQRDVPPNVTRIEDVDGHEVLFNSTDLLYTRYHENTSFISSLNGKEKTLSHEAVPVKARFMDGGFVRHLVPENASGFVYRSGTTQDLVSMDPVAHNIFDADGPTAAAALASKGLVAFNGGKRTVIPTTARVREVEVRNGDIAFIEGEAGSGLLRFAAATILVKNSTGVRPVAGHLVKAPGSATVYLAADDGKRYVFSGLSQFSGWYGADFSSVRTVSPAKISNLPLSGIVIFRPGYKLLKVASQPQVYAVGQDGRLHWVRSQDVAATMFGPNWNRGIETIDATLMADYGVGAPIADLVAYNTTLYGSK